MNRSLVCFTVIAAALPTPLSAGSAPGLCVSSKLVLERDHELAEAAKAAYPQASITNRDDACIYPYQLLRYGDADVLIATGGKPGEGCHGCGATLSASVIRRLPDRLRVVARFANFGSEGTLGDPGRITAMQLAGHDAFVVESGGTFQGYTSVGLTFYVFHDGRLVEAKPHLPLYASDDGAKEVGATSVDGAWRVPPGRLDVVVIDYKVRVGKHVRQASATWAYRKDAFILKSGRVPPELESAGGN